MAETDAENVTDMQEEKKTERVQNKIADDFYYDPSALKKPLIPNELPRDCCALLTTAGFEAQKRNNMYFVDNRTMIFASGNAVVFYGMYLIMH